jgi:hypothetical protein
VNGSPNDARIIIFLVVDPNRDRLLNTGVGQIIRHWINDSTVRLDCHLQSGFADRTSIGRGKVAPSSPINFFECFRTDLAVLTGFRLHFQID